MSARSSALNGLLVVDKPGRPLTNPDADPQLLLARSSLKLPIPQTARLPTSHDIVAQVRRWSGQRRIGHTGTLDPMASGLLLLCLGTATRLVEYYQGEEKSYYAEIVLGTATDTYDAMGKVTATASIPPLSAPAIALALAEFQGEIEQTPPAFSAIKQDGKALYVRARRGEVVTAPPRRVTVHELDLLAFAPPERIAVRVRCTAGAYIRSLAHDLGRALGTYGHLDVLRRERVGAFTLAQAATLAQVELLGSAERLQELLLPPGKGLPLPALQLGEDELRRLGFGQMVTLPAAASEPAGLLAQAYDQAGELAGIIRRLQPSEEVTDQWQWKAEKWLRQETQHADLP